MTRPIPAFDGRVWRVIGAPLVAGSGQGPLTGETVAVKDLYEVAGFGVGAGNPAYLAEARPADATAEALQMLLDAGADIRGIARTDEFAYSLAGANAHYGMPPNPAAPSRVPGGSTSGSATAVSLGQASIGWGTDTAGSIRVPAAYQGLYGIRTTHGVVSRRGLLPLAPSFDAVGWVTRDAELLLRVGEVLLGQQQVSAPPPVIVAVSELLNLAEPEVRAAVSTALPAETSIEHWPLPDLDAWMSAFSMVQGFEAWATHGGWLASRLASLGPGVRDRFERASAITEADAERARSIVGEAREQIRGLVGDRVVALPGAGSVAPHPSDVATAREPTLRLTCLASIAGLPAVAIPLRTASDLPTAVTLIAAPERDRDLLTLARSGWTQVGAPPTSR